MTTYSKNGFAEPKFYHSGDTINILNRDNNKWFLSEAQYLLVTAERDSILYMNQKWQYALNIN